VRELRGGGAGARVAALSGPAGLLLQRETKRRGRGSRGIIIANEYSVLAGSAIGGGGVSRSMS